MIKIWSSENKLFKSNGRRNLFCFYISLFLPVYNQINYFFLLLILNKYISELIILLTLFFD